MYQNDITEGERLNQITEKIIGAAIEVHRSMGPGLLDSAYETCIAYELLKNGLEVETQRPLHRENSKQFPRASASSVISAVIIMRTMHSPRSLR